MVDRTGRVLYCMFKYEFETDMRVRDECLPCEQGRHSTELRLLVVTQTAFHFLDLF